MSSATTAVSFHSLAPILAAALLLPACSARNVGDETPLCERCHGGNGSAAPPRTVHGATDTTARGVGAHRQHLEAGPVRGPIECRECHIVPGPTPEDNPDGHIGDGVTVKFLGVLGGAHVPPGTDCASPSARCPTWDTAAAPGRCANVYCHGASLNAAGTNTVPAWTGGASEAACGTCHAVPPPAPQHPARVACDPCHPGYTSTSVNLATHIDGKLDVIVSCTSCHGDPLRASNPAAPPVGTNGETATTTRAVGAHQAHLTDGLVRVAIACEECHVVPTSTSHSDGVVQLAWGALARTSGATPSWDGVSCASTYCHGATLAAGGTNTVPVWTAGASQAACGTCHAAPPPPPHPSRTSCGTCHPGYTPTTVNLAVHIDGTVDVTLSCASCHGDASRPSNQAAPPVGTSGETATTTRAVGAHQAHLTDGLVRVAIACEECHVVPTSTSHSDGVVEFTWGPLATARGAQPAWNAGTERCSNVYCHGGRGLGVADPGGNGETPRWTQVDGTQVQCGSCHGYPPLPSHAERGSNCHACHGQTVNADNVTIDVAGGYHIDGVVQAIGGACGDCHGVPPATGAHLIHAHFTQPTDTSYGSLLTYEDLPPAARGTTYAFGCGHCHPLSSAFHMDGTIEVVLTPPGLPASDHDLKQRNAANAAYDPDGATGGCSGVYCHSSGQASPTYRKSPPWTAAPGTIGCAGCHDDPPRYASGGPGAADANSHLVLADDGWESGHFAGLPGPWHTSKHGGNWSASEDAAPITCQTCHAATVDPAATGPSGFYWLDTTGDYHLPGGAAARLTSPKYARLQCTACHDGAAVASGAGRVLPLRHVNGRRDVAFDARTTLPALPWLPAAPNAPTRPYWVTNDASGVALPDPAIPDALRDGATLSVHLGSASYDAATKTCASVACHLQQTAVTWGAPHGWVACQTCHGF